MKGHTVIELTDVRTGKVKKYEDDNMVTNALNDIVNCYPRGLESVLSSGSTKGFKPLEWFSPLKDNLLGGILIFEEELNSDPSDYYQAGGVIGYANEEINTTDDTKRGSINMGESEFDETSCKWVWDFATNQANGTIRSLGLTSKQAGQYGLGNKYGIPVIRNEISTKYPTRKSSDYRYYSPNWMDIEKQYFGSIAYIGAKRFELAKTLFQTNAVRLNAPIIGDIPFEKISINTSKFGSNNYIAFCDGGGDHMWGFNSRGNSSGDAVVDWIKINKETGDAEEGTWTLSGVHLYSLGIVGELSSIYNKKCTIRDDYLYACAYNFDGLYKININNPVDVTFISGTVLNKWDDTKGLITLHGVVYGTNFYIDKNDIFCEMITNNQYQSTFKNNNGACQSEIGPWRYEMSKSGGMSSLVLDGFYLATKNNLSEPVTKTSAQTMKITYTLSEISE